MRTDETKSDIPLQPSEHPNPSRQLERQVRPLVFLDVDGVLNSRQWFETQESKNIIETVEGHIDPAAVRRLNRICSETGARVVVSSTWRNGSLFDVLLTMLKKYGFTGEVIGKTGRRECDDCVRGNQIRRWMKDNIEDSWAFDKYVILDDDSDMLYWQKDNFVQTSSETGGLTDELADRAIEILKRERVVVPRTRVKIPAA